MVDDFCWGGVICFMMLIMLFPQIEVYSELGGKPQTWDHNKKGTVTNYYYYNEGKRKDLMNVMDIHMTPQTFANLSLAEYVFVSLSLALVIAVLPSSSQPDSLQSNQTGASEPLLGNCCRL